MKVLLWGLVAIAIVAVCIKKIRDFRSGKFCDCGCEDCPSKCKSPKEFKK